MRTAATTTDIHATPLDAVVLDALAAFPARLAAHFHAFPVAARHWSPPDWDGVPSEPFTALEQLCHVRDVEIDGYHVRFARTLAEERPDLPSLDGFGLARARAYASADPETVLKDIAAARTRTLAMIRHWDASALTRGAIFEGHAITLAGLVFMLASHDQQHLAGLAWLRARLTGAAH